MRLPRKAKTSVTHSDAAPHDGSDRKPKHVATPVLKKSYVELNTLFLILFIRDPPQDKTRWPHGSEGII